jgi:hypothetical protein
MAMLMFQCSYTYGTVVEDDILSERNAKGFLPVPKPIANARLLVLEIRGIIE